MINLNIPFFTPSVKRLIKLNTYIFLIILILFNLLLIFFIYSVVNNNLDHRIIHEIENIKKGLNIDNNTISVSDSSEFLESDLFEITESPYFLQIYNLKAELIIYSRNVTLFNDLPPYNPSSFEKTKIENIVYKNKRFRICYTPLVDKNGKVIAFLRLSIFNKDFETILLNLLYYNLLSFLVIFFVVIILSIITAKKTFKPINEIIKTANLFNMQNLNVRINVAAENTDEIGRLRDTLNRLFEHIDKHVNELSGFSNQVSHQLMNPLTALKIEIEYLLRKEKTNSEYSETLKKLEYQTNTMINIVNTLLLIAKSGRSKIINTKILNISNLIENVVNNVYNKANIKVNIDKNLFIKGEQEKFAMVIGNLLDNAIKYSPENSEIHIKSKIIDNSIFISIIDNGIGIPDNEKDKIFGKFYRSEIVENLGIPGYGLGLPLCRSIIEEAGGIIQVENNFPKGTIITIILPRVELSDF